MDLCSGNILNVEEISVQWKSVQLDCLCSIVSVDIRSVCVVEMCSGN